MPRPSQHTAALLLRSVDYGDADRIVTLLTRDFGKVAALARGARRSKKRFQGALEPFTTLDVALMLGSGELATLTDARIVRAHTRLFASLEGMAAAGAALELVRELVPPREPDLRMFDTAVELLDVLETGVSGVEAKGVAFALRALSLAGVGARFDVCAGCSRRAPEGQSAYFDLERGALRCRACGGQGVLLAGTTRARFLAATTRAWMSGTETWERTDVDLGRRLVARSVEAHFGKALRGYDARATLRPAGIAPGRVSDVPA